MSILTLDLGKQTGWAILHDGIIQSGSESFHGSRFSGGGMTFLKFRSWLNSLKEKFQDISTVYFEEVRRHLGTDAAHCYGGFLAHLTAWCEENNVPYQGVPVKTIKRFITGKGNASKAEVIEAVKKKGFVPQDDNEADALALMFLAQKLGNTGLTEQYNSDVRCKDKNINDIA
jgi:crossover junction endodeoxyribonuclease RuvC